MKVPAPDQSNFKPAPEGIHQARIYQVVDLGTQATDFQGQSSQRRKVRLTLELFGEECRLEDGRPMSLGVTRTVSLFETSRLRKDLEAIRGKGFTSEELGSVDLVRLAGAYCKVFVLHVPKGDGITARIDRFLKWPPTEEKPEAVNPISIFDFENPTQQGFASLAEWLKETIIKSPEYRSWANGNDSDESNNDDDFPI